ncbi:hypothetical protein DY138_00690 [Apilactobacillus timberlakei]|uniref:hypothetical protein n=1 Tax=Apilactobacillus timberlakei TaxID=2008380 RepID=UPI001129277D|nr:hypothetical protein [Apilactobacillus timberlakei]TPR19986.1 hypothetical protein DY138_00690 [Apilactobacillus timberlakei]TPR21704.1 hypothetical protein DY061_00605 [Apilactobacillus timberlakei]TPR22950.1 hypothetical protein DY083_02425 [Apilactobacillus timberlakei]
MSYKVIQSFTDSNPNSADDKDNLHAYRKGDDYPFLPQSYNGAKTQERLAQLLNPTGPNDNFDSPVIAEVDEKDG